MDRCIIIFQGTLIWQGNEESSFWWHSGWTGRSYFNKSFCFCRQLNRICLKRFVWIVVDRCDNFFFNPAIVYHHDFKIISQYYSVSFHRSLQQRTYEKMNSSPILPILIHYPSGRKTEFTFHINATFLLSPVDWMIRHRSGLLAGSENIKRHWVMFLKQRYRRSRHPQCAVIEHVGLTGFCSAIGSVSAPVTPVTLMIFLNASHLNIIRGVRLQGLQSEGFVAYLSEVLRHLRNIKLMRKTSL